MVSTFWWTALAVVAALIAGMLWCQYANDATAKRNFQASQKRAEIIIKSGAGNATSYEKYKKTVRGGDAVEFSAVRDLAKSGRLDVPSLSDRLAVHDQYYEGG